MTQQPIPTASELEGSPDAEADRTTLCANWRRGCNGVTDGPQNGSLTLCDECQERLDDILAASNRTVKRLDRFQQTGKYD